jgi:glyoxylase-like metal-dependent hydrolase (beta-lactamase superfamily II)
MTLEGTNTWVLRGPGASGCVVVDPGPADETHLAAVAAHGPVAAVLVTHGHPDHTAGIPRFAELSGVRVREVAPEETFRIAGLHIAALHTPGHTADSYCFLVKEGDDRAVLTGDTILGHGTTVVAWPDGELGAYLTSLERLVGLGPIPVLPGHGPVLPDCGAAARFYLNHRWERLDQVRTAVAAGATTPHEVVEIVYVDVDRALWPAAELSVRAQLAYLRRESEATEARLDPP